MKKLSLFLLIVAVYAAHQDLWNWSKPEPMIFGFLPAGLAYQAAYSIACAALSYRFLESPFLALKQRFSHVASRPGG